MDMESRSHFCRSKRHRVRNRSMSVQILCARSSVISNFTSASAVFTLTIPVKGSVDLVEIETSVILCASFIEQSLQNCWVYFRGWLIFRHATEPDTTAGFARFQMVSSAGCRFVSFFLS